MYATRLFNLTVTNVPGPQQPLCALGSWMREAVEESLGELRELASLTA